MCREYFEGEKDRDFKFEDGTGFSSFELQNLGKIQVNISNKYYLSQQIKASAQIILRELIPD